MARDDDTVYVAQQHTFGRKGVAIIGIFAGEDEARGACKRREEENGYRLRAGYEVVQFVVGMYEYERKK